MVTLFKIDLTLKNFYQLQERNVCYSDKFGDMSWNDVMTLCY